MAKRKLDQDHQMIVCLHPPAAPSRNMLDFVHSEALRQKKLPKMTLPPYVAVIINLLNHS